MSTQRTESTGLPVREEEAERILAEVTDPVVSNLMKLCLAKARMRFMRWEGTTEDEWKAQLPTTPFDMAFFASVLREAFSKRETVERLLRGESLESATGWDV